MSKTLVSIIIPNYNEIENVKRGVIGEVVDFLKKQTFGWEIIISDDGSTDDSLAEIKRITKGNKLIRILPNKHAGKPYALRAGINAAAGEYVLLTDMDQSTPISELNKLLPFIKQNYQVVIGSRGSKRSDTTLTRQLASVIFQLARRAILLPRIKDTQCGFKLIKTSLAKQIFSEMRIFGRANNAKGWKVTAYDVELLYLTRKHKKPIKEVKVIWKNEDISSGKNRNFVKESIEMFMEILRVRANDVLGKYD